MAINKNTRYLIIALTVITVTAFGMVLAALGARALGGAGFTAGASEILSAEDVIRPTIAKEEKYYALPGMESQKNALSSAETGVLKKFDAAYTELKSSEPDSDLGADSSGGYGALKRPPKKLYGNAAFGVGSQAGVNSKVSRVGSPALGVNAMMGNFAESQAFAEGVVRARGAYAIDAESGAVIFAHNETARHPIASMQKIMTALLIFEAVEKGKLSLDDDISVSERASGMGGSQIFLDSGTVHKLHGLLKSIIIASANDSCVAVAEALSGSEESFVAEMNRRAVELAMDNTNFVNCTGLPAEGQYSCAADVSKMMRALVRHGEYFKYSGIWLENYVHPDGRETVMTNTNKLIRSLNGCDGGKTGFTNEAKFCVAATAKRESMRLIAVVIGAESGPVRFETAASVLNVGFANYENRRIADADKPYMTLEVKRGRVKETAVYTEKSVYIFAKKNEEKDVRFEVSSNGVKAPLKSGAKVGTLTVYVGGDKYDEVALVIRENLEKSRLTDEIKKIIGKF
ncbi:MAG: D-alanyl-D-alanine carboxypeptidase [Clostridiaceae bacterium]|jgi:D-alanyl-D-alanine carboxypeptidase (penicillin-binding protein 5/6)|nr:D-alanyl-D-alanine carboxypeptidase [Clostridiaceae bacterium]